MLGNKEWLEVVDLLSRINKDWYDIRKGMIQPLNKIFGFEFPPDKIEAFFYSWTLSMHDVYLAVCTSHSDLPKL